MIKDRGKRFENLVACHLLNWCLFKQDAEGREFGLRCFRDIDKGEVDFVIMEDELPIYFIEGKTSGKAISRSLYYLKIRFPDTQAVQLVLEDDADLISKDNIRIRAAHRFLSELIWAVQN